MFDRILVPTNGSDHSAAAARVGAVLADRFDAELHAVHVVDVDELPIGAGEEVLGELKTHAESMVKVVETVAADAGVETTTAVLQNGITAHRGVVQYATDHDADLVVMGTHGRTGLNRVILGSIAEWTIRESPAPVLTLREGTTFDPNLRELVVPTDGSDAAEHAADLAVALAGSTGARLHVVHVMDRGVIWEDADARQVTDALSAAGKRAIARVVDRAETAGIDRVEHAVLQGAPHRRIVDYAAEHGADLVVMGTHGRTGLERFLLGSVTERVVRLSGVPVLAVREGVTD
jgi:nucleotide-binding universal stress UspA family protein